MKHYTSVAANCVIVRPLTPIKATANAVHPHRVAFITNLLLRKRNQTDSVKRFGKRCCGQGFPTKTAERLAINRNTLHKKHRLTIGVGSTLSGGDDSLQSTLDESRTVTDAECSVVFAA